MNLDKPKLEYTVLEYYVPGNIEGNSIYGVSEFLSMLEFLSFPEQTVQNIFNTLNILKLEYKKYTDITECIKIRMRQIEPGLLIIEIEVTLPIVRNKYLESRLFQERGICRVANTSGPYNKDIFEA